MDEYLEILLEKVAEVYKNAQNGTIKDLDVQGNVVSNEKLIINAEPTENPNVYNYITDNLNIRLYVRGLFENTVLYHKDKPIMYKDLDKVKDSTDIKLNVINNITKLQDVLGPAELGDISDEVERGTR